MRKTEQKGITLIALVITIIVLLILAGVAISMLSGENGILKKAAEAKEKTEEAQKQEETTLIDYELTSHFVLNNLKYKCSYGFITGITTEKTENGIVAELASNLVKALPEGYYLYKTDKSGKELKVTGEPITATDTETLLGSGMAIKKDEKIVAITVVFGDIDGNGKNNVDDMNSIRLVMNSKDKIKDTNYTYAIIASDLDHNGIIDNYDFKKEIAYIESGLQTGSFEQNVSAPNPELLKIQNIDTATQAFIQDGLPEGYNITKDAETGRYILTGVNIGVTTQEELKALIPEILEIKRSGGYTDPIQKGDKVYIIPNYYGFDDEDYTFRAVID